MKKVPNHVMIGGQKFRIIVGTLENGDFGRMYFDERKIVIDNGAGFCIFRLPYAKSTVSMAEDCEFTVAWLVGQICAT